MKKAKVEIEETVAFRPGGTDRAIRELAQATHRLTMRRIRDSLPGRIATKRLVLRAPIRGDVPDLVKLADNKAIAEKLARLPSPYTRADGVAFVEIFAQRPDERPYAIILDDHFIGVVGFTFFEGRPPELGYWLGEPHWGKGLMTEAARGLIDAAHRTPHFELIAARALADNAGSLNVLAKLGFKPTGTAPAIGAPGDGRPAVALELRRPRWM
ncbi:MAG TPA: GNAT family N-acetyltransferase [Devosia sp.]|jgi:RimJ/RimL family protein N-acetyltransferase|nr:GNAT family N-acetyltransferase [Devosia sp.]